MKAINIRRGFATNSSSSHSIIKVSAKNKKDLYDDDSDGEFGWNTFLCLSKESKLRYFAATLWTNIGGRWEDNEKDKSKKKRIVAKAFPDVEFDSGDYVDHQSLFEVPKYADGEYAIDFFKEFAYSIANNENLVIEGGNDNCDDKFRPQIGVVYEPIMRESSYYKIRKESFGWTLFDVNYGNKIRYSNKLEEMDSIENNNNITPDLIDLRISHKCEHNCSFCYNNSTPDGKETLYVNDIIDVLAEKGVFEIAFGGGETTNHPRLLEILEYTREKGITPNFTTRETDWLKYPSFADRLFNITGSIGISINTVSDIEKILKHRPNLYNITLHYVMGLESLSEFKKVINFIEEKKLYGTKMLLLGFKNTGRASEIKEKIYTVDWVEFINKTEYISFAIDTSLALKYEKLLKKNSISKVFYHTTEGRFSKYIDAVTKTINESSYSTKPAESFEKRYKSTDKELLGELLLKKL